jgi:hypothetical protein
VLVSFSFFHNMEDEANGTSEPAATSICLCVQMFMTKH